ncbi:hypothetical protein AX16_001686 [Volvariella volvacea WC 439]|nr:hypothetical protein AX16_001686 [Volvariella volvacea WC 439]
MSSNVPISSNNNITAPTPQNTPLNQAPISLGLSRPTVPDIAEDNEQEDIPKISTQSIQKDALEHTMLGLVEGRLAGLIGKSSGYIENLPTEVKLSIEALKGIQVKQNDLQNKFRLEVLELEKKYLALHRPLYERRHAIVTGKEKPTEEEITAGEEVSAKEDDDYTPLPKDNISAAAAIPEFWLTALRNHLGISELITDRDAGALKHLVDIRLEYLDEPNAPDAEPRRGFKLLFVFTPNEYFDNEILEKTYLYQQELGYTGDLVYDRAIGSEIKWKEDKDLTKEFEIKKQRNKTTNRTRLVRKAKPADSFFNFFNPPVFPEEEDDVDPEEAEEIEEKLEIDYQIGEDLKDKIIPRAIDYFTGKALEFDMMEEDEFPDEDDEDEVSAEEDEDSEDNDVPARRRGPPKGSSGSGNVNPEECKQQ